MIKEAYCSYEVSKLLKEKGFDFSHIECNKWYVTESYSTGVHWNSISYEIGDITREYVGGKVIPLITHQMAMRWLREGKYILIFIVPAKDESGNLQYMADVLTWNEDEGLYESIWCTADYVYEKTVEAALKYSLENLI